MSHKIERPAAVAGASAEIAAPEQPAVFTIPQAAKALQVSIKTIYNALAAGKIFSVYILGARRIPADEIRRLSSLGTIATPEQIEAALSSRESRKSGMGVSWRWPAVWLPARSRLGRPQSESCRARKSSRTTEGTHA